MHAALADVLTDLVQNSVEAGARRIDVVLEEGAENIRFAVEDDGKGMDRGTLERASDPFKSDGIKHPGRRVGLGIPFLNMSAQQAGGQVMIESEPGRGTKVEAVFPAGNMDRPPLGDPVLMWLQCLIFEGSYGMGILRTRKGPDDVERSYRIDREELIEALDGLEDAGSLGLLKEYLTSMEQSLNG
jgi:anti-sigma regulatory factor (Ser/Thr protein kinase)